MLPHCESKGHYRNIVATIKSLYKDIQNQKSLANYKLYEKPNRYSIPLFEVELEEPEMDYSELSSFFGKI